MTLELRSLLKRELDDVEQNRGLQCFHPFDANRTQELMAALNGTRETLEIVIQSLEGDWEWLQLEEDEDE